ncbi:hypothetical protein SDC9_178497 [bioreactor metagenome]|uniref:Uncharacterized protein n=1 Tax=bioreactor metagenome TaxID=1076179 RepID=A0A645GXQ0_9ZZZZ
MAGQLFDGAGLVLIDRIDLRNFMRDFLDGFTDAFQCGRNLRRRTRTVDSQLADFFGNDTKSAAMFTDPRSFNGGIEA